LIADAVDGAVGPFGRSGRERFGVDVAGGSVEGERAEGGAGAGAVDLDFAEVEEGAITEIGGRRSGGAQGRGYRVES